MYGLYIPWLYLALMNINQIIPWDVPRWMLFWVAPELFLLTLTLPGLVYALILTVIMFAPESESYKPWRELILVIGIPAAWYLVFNVILSILHFRFDVSGIFQHIMPIVLILSTVLFLFAIARLLYIFLKNRQGMLNLLVNLMVIILPSAGLYVNQSMNGIFGDFSHPAYYILAFVTGALLILPSPKLTGLRLALFLAKSILFPFTVYFFIVFLPFLPLAIPLILAAGTGFLILAPIVLGFKHVVSLRDDLMMLKDSFRYPFALSGLMILGCTIIPLVLYCMVINDNAQIQNALTYVYRTPYQMDKEIRVSPAALKRALKNIKANKSEDSRVGFGVGERTPYLTSLYNWLALDNLTLSDHRIQTLERIFLGKITKENSSKRTRVLSGKSEQSVKIKSINTVTGYDPVQKVFKSRINLEIANTSDRNLREYATVFELPAGCYISGYYLDINKQRKQGLLTDKRAATWVYQQIRDERKDPGMLVYASGNRVRFQIYPFAGNEIRKTGLELIHCQPVQVILDGRRVDLGNDTPVTSGEHSVKTGSYIPATVKKTLPKVKRNAHYYFVLDYSGEAHKDTTAYQDQVKQCVRKYQMNPAHTTIVAANYRFKDFPLQGDWQTNLEGIKTEAGFDLDRIVKNILYHHYRSETNQYPVIIAVSGLPDHWRLFDNDYDTWQITFPESNDYYRLGDDNSLYRLSLVNPYEDARGQRVAEMNSSFVLGWPRLHPRQYLRDDAKDSIVLTEAAFNNQPIKTEGSTWETGLLIDLAQLGLILNPADYHARELALIRKSIESGIMTRATSYIVLENKAQEAALRSKQHQILSTGKIVDLSNQDQLDPQPEMAEPPLWVILFLGIGIFFGKRLRKFRIKTA